MGEKELFTWQGTGKKKKKSGNEVKISANSL